MPETLYRKADLLIRLGRTDEAQTVLRRLVEQYPQQRLVGAGPAAPDPPDHA